MTKPVKIIPDGYHSATPYLVVNGAARAIDFYKQVFDAEEVARFPGPGGNMIMHAVIRIGDSFIYLSDEFPGSNCSPLSPKNLGGTTGGIHLYVADVDATVRRAVAAGAELRMPITDMFWGDRYGKLCDPFGHEWSVATHKEDVTIEEIGRRAEAFFAQMEHQPA
jgi:uncharacterized glyoxalase superfamily protein PhnB